MIHKGVTLRGLEVFEAVAATGSVAQAAHLLELSQPAVSLQLRNLEAALEVTLLDHSKRPMQLTQPGTAFLARSKKALAQLRIAQTELSIADLHKLTALSIGVIDDFENDLTPRLATGLAENLTECHFTLITAPSYDILDQLAEQKLHVGITASDARMHEGLIEYPLVSDPFIAVLPKGSHRSDLEDRLHEMPLLRYQSDQLIARQISLHLKREGVDFQSRFEIGSHMALMAMVANGIGWAVTTPLGYMRAARFHNQIEPYALPFAPFARQISLYTGSDWVGEIPGTMALTMRQLMQTHMIEPALANCPWLAQSFRILGDGLDDGASV